MSNYVTLDELKTMNEGELSNRWHCGKFPFEMMICGACITMHGNPGQGRYCNHSDVAHQLKPMWAKADHRTYPISLIKPHLEEIYALRLFYKHLYRTNPLEIMWEKVEQVIESLEVVR